MTREDKLQIIHHFYHAFQEKDAEKMISFYHQDIVFEDPAFGKLKGEKAKNMWRMLIQNGKDLNIVFGQIREENNQYKAHWDATYTFSATKRKVLNRIDAEFKFSDDGKIIEHKDIFDFHQWASQALGFPGKLLGKTAFFQRFFRKKALGLLASFESKR